LEDLCCYQYDVGYWSISTKPHGFPSQKAAGFTHTGVKTARISKYKNLFIERIPSQITRHFKRQPSEWVSQTLGLYYTSHQQLRKQTNTGASICLQKHTNSRAHELAQIPDLYNPPIQSCFTCGLNLLHIEINSDIWNLKLY
jgi:hypothetical protein